MTLNYYCGDDEKMTHGNNTFIPPGVYVQWEKKKEWKKELNGNLQCINIEWSPLMPHYTNATLLSFFASISIAHRDFNEKTNTITLM
jgi:hypothetical protein